MNTLLQGSQRLTQDCLKAPLSLAPGAILQAWCQRGKRRTRWSHLAVTGTRAEILPGLQRPRRRHRHRRTCAHTKQNMHFWTHTHTHTHRERSEQGNTLSGLESRAGCGDFAVAGHSHLSPAKAVAPTPGQSSKPRGEARGGQWGMAGVRALLRADSQPTQGAKWREYEFILDYPLKWFSIARKESCDLEDLKTVTQQSVSPLPIRFAQGPKES